MTKIVYELEIQYRLLTNTKHSVYGGQCLDYAYIMEHGKSEREVRKKIEKAIKLNWKLYGRLMMEKRDLYTEDGINERIKNLHKCVNCGINNMKIKLDEELKLS